MARKLEAGVLGFTRVRTDVTEIEILMPGSLLLSELFRKRGRSVGLKKPG